MTKSSSATARSKASATERAVAPTNPWSWTWVLIGSIGVSVIAYFAGMVNINSLFGQQPGWLPGHLISILVTISLTFWVAVTAARAAISQRPIREVLSWVRTEQVVSTWLGSLLFASVVFMVARLLGALVEGSPGIEAVLILSNMFAFARALMVTYETHYSDFTLRGKKPAKTKDAGEPVTFKRKAWNFAKQIMWFRSTVGKMSLPTIQAFVFLVVPVALWSLFVSVVFTGGSAAAQPVYDLAVLPFMVVSIRVWAWFSINGGVLGLAKVSDKRML